MRRSDEIGRSALLETLNEIDRQQRIAFVQPLRVKIGFIYFPSSQFMANSLKRMLCLYKFMVVYRVEFW
jgi:hypothetical protein